MKLVDWLAERVTDDARALAWFEGAGSDDRIARAFKELLSGYQIDPSEILTTTRMLADGERPGLVEVRDIDFHSICAHHFLPFFGKVDLAYVPGDRILGLGKLPRIVAAYARRFQIQEDLAREVAHAMVDFGHARGVRVRAPAHSTSACAVADRPAPPRSLTRSTPLAAWTSLNSPLKLGVAAAILLGFVGMACATEPVAETRTLSFSLRSKPLATRELSSLTEKIPPQKVRVFEPYEEREVTFDAIPLNAVLDAIYGKVWRQEQELLMTCKDGYQPSIPVRRALDHKAWIAFDRTDQEAFDILKLESGRRQRVDVSPFYLIWENLDNEQVRNDGDYGWPYQLVAIDLIQPRLHFPASAPPEGASARAVAGYESFRMYCGKCHAVNGEGGVLGPELNYPVSPVEYWKRDWLRKWIDDPTQIRPAARMPGLSPSVADRMKTIDEIIAYLEVMTDKKIAPGNGN